MKKAFLIILIIYTVLYSEDIDLIYSKGVYHVPITLNKQMTLNFVVDSGAASIHLSKSVYNKLERAGTIEKSDLMGIGHSQIANGEITQSQIINIKELKIGSIILYDVEAYIGNNNAPLLLGQSVLKQLEPWSLDTTNKKLIISKKSKKNSKVERFIKKKLRIESSQNIEAIMNFYADSVNYFGKRHMLKEIIEKKKINSSKKWSSKVFKFINLIKVIRGNEETAEIKYLSSYNLYNKNNNIGVYGKSINTIIIQKIEGELKIIKEESQILSKKRYKKMNKTIL